MTERDAEIEAAAKEFARRHRNTCYPEASEAESLIAAKAIIAAYEQERAKDGAVAFRRLATFGYHYAADRNSLEKGYTGARNPIEPLYLHPSPAADVKALREALEQLRDHQEQLDPDGIRAGVSRQALEIILAALATSGGGE